jgi:hypothetical protein
MKKYFTADDAREARKAYIEKKKQEEFEKVANTEEFDDILDAVRYHALRGETKFKMLPRSVEFYQHKYDSKLDIPEETREFSDAEYAVFDALRELGYVVNYIRAAEAVGNMGVVLEGMNPMMGDAPLRIAQCEILWG